jgi:hypothetical protein
LFIIVLLITTYIHHRRRFRGAGIILENEGLLLAGEPGEEAFLNDKSGGNANPVMEVIPERAGSSLPEGQTFVGQPDGDNLYKGLLWMKQKFEDYREQTDQRIGTLKEQLEQRTAVAQQLKEELAQAKEKIAELTGKLSSNMNLLMNIHKELDRSLNIEKALPAATPEAASGGLSLGE